MKLIICNGKYSVWEEQQHTSTLAGQPILGQKTVNVLTTATTIYTLFFTFYLGPYMVIARRTEQIFLDDLLTSYQQIQTRFAKQLYQLYKGFEFRSLWNVDDKLSKYQRRAVDAAKGTGKLLGVFELTNALQEINQIQNKGRKCFTKFHHAVNVNKWSFDDVKNSVVRSSLVF